MSAGLHRIDIPGFTRLAGQWSLRTPLHFRPSLLLLPVALLAGGVTWVLLPLFKGEVAGSKLAGLDVAAVQQSPSSEPPTGTVTEAAGRTEAAIEGLRISSQSWRRGGFGSKALVTFTLRNDNDYAVRDVEIFCSFSRRDGMHLTDRKRVLPDTVNMKSRKTFSRVHVGFININANQAKCSPIAASRL